VTLIDTASLLYMRTWQTLKLWTRYKANFIFDLISPLLWSVGMLLLVPIYQSSSIGAMIGTSNYIAFLLLGLGFQMYQGVALWGSSSRLREELSLGMVDYVFSSPASRYWYVISSTVSLAVTDTISYIPMFAVALLFIGPSFTMLDLALAGLAVFLTVSVLAQMGALFSTLVLKFKNVNAVFVFFNFGFQILSGMLIPIQVLPDPVKVIALAFPVTFGIDILRHHLLHTIPAFPLHLQWSALLLELAILGFAARLALVYVERSARREGLHYV